MMMKKKQVIIPLGLARRITRGCPFAGFGCGPMTERCKQEWCCVRSFSGLFLRTGWELSFIDFYLPTRYWVNGRS